jgi:preprotein translocase subunit SecG
MTATLLVIHVLLAVALIGVILVQRSSSDGGGLMGGGSASLGGLMTVRGTANLLTRITSALATGFICTSLILTILAGAKHAPRSIADQIPAAAPIPMEAPATPAVPSTGTPAQPAAPAVPMSK